MKKQPIIYSADCVLGGLTRFAARPFDDSLGQQPFRVAAQGEDAPFISYISADYQCGLTRIDDLVDYLLGDA